MLSPVSYTLFYSFVRPPTAAEAAPKATISAPSTAMACVLAPGDAPGMFGMFGMFGMSMFTLGALKEGSEKEGREKEGPEDVVFSPLLLLLALALFE